MVLFGSAPKPMPWRAFGWHPHTSCHLLASNFRWEAKLGRGPGESSLKVLIALRSPFPFPFWQPDVLGWSQLPCPSLLCHVHVYDMTGQSPWEFHCVPWENLVEERQVYLPPHLEILWALLSYSAFGVLWAMVKVITQSELMFMFNVPAIDGFFQEKKDMSLLFSQGLSPSVVAGEEPFWFSLKIIAICW